MNMGAYISSMTALIVATHNLGIGFCNADIFAIVLILILLLASVFIIYHYLHWESEYKYRKLSKNNRSCGIFINNI